MNTTRSSILHRHTPRTYHAATPCYAFEPLHTYNGFAATTHASYAGDGGTLLVLRGATRGAARRIRYVLLRKMRVRERACCLQRRRYALRYGGAQRATQHCDAPRGACVDTRAREAVRR